jgi:hypothetical protein
MLDLDCEFPAVAIRGGSCTRCLAQGLDEEESTPAFGPGAALWTVNSKHFAHDSMKPLFAGMIDPCDKSRSEALFSTKARVSERVPN